MKKKLLLTAAILVLGLGCGITANAQPKTMPETTTKVYTPESIKI